MSLSPPSGLSPSLHYRGQHLSENTVLQPSRPPPSSSVPSQTSQDTRPEGSAASISPLPPSTDERMDRHSMSVCICTRDGGAGGGWREEEEEEEERGRRKGEGRGIISGQRYSWLWVKKRKQKRKEKSS